MTHEMGSIINKVDDYITEFNCDIKCRKKENISREWSKRRLKMKKKLEIKGNPTALSQVCSLDMTYLTESHIRILFLAHFKVESLNSEASEFYTLQ